MGKPLISCLILLAWGLQAGGCNCSRANLAGALLGAAYGIGTPNGIPLEWIDRTDKGQDIFQRAIEVVV